MFSVPGMVAVAVAAGAIACLCAALGGGKERKRGRERKRRQDPLPGENLDGFDPDLDRGTHERGW